MDIVARAVDLYEEGKYEEAFELSAQFDRYQQDSFFKATGQTTVEQEIQGRILVGAYKIDKEKDPKKKAALMKVYDQLCEELMQLRKGESE